MNYVSESMFIQCLESYYLDATRFKNDDDDCIRDMRRNLFLAADPPIIIYMSKYIRVNRQLR